MYLWRMAKFFLIRRLQINSFPYKCHMLAQKYLRKYLACLIFFSVCLPNSFTPIEQDILVQKKTFLKEWIEVKQFGVHLRQITFVSLTKAIKSLFEREKSIMKPVLNSSNAYFAKLSKYLRCVKTFNVGNFFISVRSKTKTHKFFIFFPLN